MKIAICSDLHLEFGPIMLHNDQAADLLILAGDICTVKTFKKKPKEINLPKIIDLPIDHYAAQYCIGRKIPEDTYNMINYFV